MYRETSGESGGLMKWMTGIWLAIFLMSACGESDMEYQSIADLDGDSEELEKNGSENGDLDICPTVQLRPGKVH